MPLPSDLRLALAPHDTYRQLMAEPARGTWLRALERPALLALIIGTAVTMSSARRVPLGLVLMGIVCWSFVLIVQWLIGVVVIGRARGRPVSMPRALELLFVGHLPWSLWILTMIGLYTFTTTSLGLAAQIHSLLVPAVWTTTIVFAFCRTALGCSPVRARLLTAAHQTMTWVVFVAYVVLVSGIGARFLALVGA
jgi:hypothetical protein